MTKHTCSRESKDGKPSLSEEDHHSSRTTTAVGPASPKASPTARRSFRVFGNSTASAPTTSKFSVVKLSAHRKWLDLKSKRSAHSSVADKTTGQSASDSRNYARFQCSFEFLFLLVSSENISEADLQDIFAVSRSEVFVRSCTLHF